MDQYFERAWFLGFCLIFILLAMGAEAATACRHEVAQSLKTGLRFSGGAVSTVRTHSYLLRVSVLGSADLTKLSQRDLTLRSRLAYFRTQD